MMTLLVRHLLQSTLFCAFVGTLALTLRGRCAGVRHALWFSGVLKFAVPATLVSGLGARAAFWIPTTKWMSSAAWRVSAALEVIDRVLPLDFPFVQTKWISTLWLTAWVAGASVCFGLWLVRWKKRNSVLRPATDEETAALRHACESIGMRRTVDLRHSYRSEGPALAGVARFTITVPAELIERLTRAEFEAVLLHELAHVRRNDNLTSFVVHCLTCMFWFHPLLWLAEARMATERELACDEMVLRWGTRPPVYARGILKVCQCHFLEAVAGVSEMRPSNLQRRIELILCRPCKARVTFTPGLLVGAVMAMATMLPFAGGYCDSCTSMGASWSAGGHGVRTIAPVVRRSFP